MLDGALLGIIEQAGVAVLTLTEDIAEGEFFASRLTRIEVLRQLRTIADSVAGMSPALRRTLAEVDWPTWDALGPLLRAPRVRAQDEAVWFAVGSTVPALLLWMRVYRKNQPELFQMTL